MTLNYVSLLITAQDAGQDAASGGVSVQPTSAVTAAGVTVVSPLPVVRQLSGGSVTISLVACDNGGTTPAAGFWAYEVTLPGDTSPRLVTVNFANGSSQRLDNLTPVIAQTTYGPAAATGAVSSVFGRTGTVVAVSGDYTASQTGALAAKASSTSVPAAALVPQVVALTDAATILVNAALGNEMRVTLGGNRAMGVPSNPADGQTLTFELVQDGTGSRTVTWPTGSAGDYDFGSGSAPTLSTAAHAVDFVAFRYSAAALAGAGAWCCLNGTGTGF